MAAKDVLGKRGEEIAALYLEDHGYRVLDHRWRCDIGEIDLVTRKGVETVFVEVKTRTSTTYGHPFEAITTAKLARMRRLAAAWCRQADVPFARIRIDVVSVIAPPDEVPTIEHLKGVF